MPSEIHYPGTPPGKTASIKTDDRVVLENGVIRCDWGLEAGHVKRLIVENRHTGQIANLGQNCLPRVVLDEGHVVDLVALNPETPLELNENTVAVNFKDAVSGLQIQWSARLEDDANAVIHSLAVKASTDTLIKEVVFLTAALSKARQVGEVDGSVVVNGDLFMAIEHPLAKNVVEAQARVRCALPQSGVLDAGKSRTFSFAVGAVPPRQLRRGFLYYIERRRAYPYRPFLHYNNWYDVYLGRPLERITESECLDTIEYYGKELVQKRNVKLDAFLWDDGWDNFNSLWQFHTGFPDGFKNLNAAARKYGAGQGVWMSPWGGYGPSKEKRLAYGRSQGYETNASGYAMGGPTYAKAFRDVCLNMMREHGVKIFKFDGMGGGNTAAGAEAELSDDINAILELTRTLRRENPELFISATIGTWASPYWLLYADSIWRQGGDTGHSGPGNPRQQWNNYRDSFCYERIVQRGPLYPLNSLMLHGIVIGNREGRAPADMGLEEKSTVDEIWSFFGSGTCLQELYISPHVMTETMADELAAAAKWARANRDTLVDTHWIGGDPRHGEVYGWASWSPDKGIVALRNPSDSAQSFRFTPKAALELPEQFVQNAMTARMVYPRDYRLPVESVDVAHPVELDLQPFEVLVVEF